MPTNALGSGTCNVPVNMLERERRIIGRLAFSGDMSTGAWIRQAVREKLEREHPGLAAELKELRFRRVSKILATFFELPPQYGR